MQLCCPKCGQRLNTPDEAAGKKAKCAKCGRIFVVESETFEYSTEIVGPVKAKPRLGIYVAIAAPILICGLWIAVVVSSQSPPSKRLEPLHTLKQRLETANTWAESLRTKKAAATDTVAIAARQAQHMEAVKWSAKDESELNEWEAEIKAIRDELTDRGQ